jgi:hypothetical protein
MTHIARGRRRRPGHHAHHRETRYRHRCGSFQYKEPVLYRFRTGRGDCGHAAFSLGAAEHRLRVPSRAAQPDTRGDLGNAIAQREQAVEQGEGERARFRESGASWRAWCAAASPSHTTDPAAKPSSRYETEFPGGTRADPAHCLRGPATPRHRTPRQVRPAASPAGSTGGQWRRHRA